MAGKKKVGRKRHHKGTKVLPAHMLGKTMHKRTRRKKA